MTPTLRGLATNYGGPIRRRPMSDASASRLRGVRAAQPALQPGQALAGRLAARPVHRRLARHPREPDRADARDRGALPRRRREAPLLPVGRVPDGPLARQQPPEPRHARRGRARRWPTLGVDLEALRELEPDAALGNGGLGRLAACFLDSLASLDMPGFGYGINYEHGLFRQAIEDGQQREYPDSWRAQGSPWLIMRRDETLRVPVYGVVEKLGDGDGLAKTRWTHQRIMLGVPHDLPIVGFGGRTVNWLRLYSARSPPTSSTSASSTRATTCAPSSRSSRSSASRRCSTRPSRRARARSCGSCRSTSSSPARCATSSRATSRPAARFDTLPRQGRDPAERHAPGARGRGAGAAASSTTTGCRFERRSSSRSGRFAYTNHTLLPEALERWPSRSCSASCRATCRSSS